MQTLITVIHVVTCVLLVLVILVQSGKGAEISTSLGGSSQTVFGSSGGANFFTRFTSVAAGIFMVTSLTLTLLGGQSKKSLFEAMSSTSSPAATQNAAPTSEQKPVESAPADTAAPITDAAPQPEAK